MTKRKRSRKRVDVFISSTSRDLREYRSKVKDIVISMGMYPIIMESFHPTNSSAVQRCYDEVQQAEIFIGIYAHRYGYRPAAGMDFPGGQTDGEKSITHLEYEWAVEMDIPIILFLIDEENPPKWPEKYIDKDEECERLLRFKEHLQKNHIIGFFDSISDLQVKVTTALANVTAYLPQELSEDDDRPPLIYISYLKIYDDFVKKLGIKIRESGFQTWIDLEDTMPGADRDLAVEKALDAADAMIVVLTETAVKSNKVKGEWRYFFDQDKKIYPVIVEDCKIPFRLRMFYYVDCTKVDEHERAITDLVVALQRDADNGWQEED